MRLNVFFNKHYNIETIASSALSLKNMIPVESIDQLPDDDLGFQVSVYDMYDEKQITDGIKEISGVVRVEKINSAPCP